MTRMAKRLLSLFMAMILVVTMAMPVMAEEQVNAELLPDTGIAAGETGNVPAEDPAQPEQTTNEALPVAENIPEEPMPDGDTALIGENPGEPVAEEAAPTEETPVEENTAETPAEETPVEGNPEGEVPAEGTPAEEIPSEEPVALKKGFALIVKKADVTKKAESRKAAYVLAKDALVLAEEIEGNTERVKVQFILNGEKITGYVEAGAVSFIDGEPDGKYAALAVGSLYEMADYATEITEDPATGEAVEEPAADESIEEPAVEETTEEPAIEEMIEEPAVEEIAGKPAIEEPVEGPVVEEIIGEPVTEEAVEEVVEEPAVEETMVEPVMEEAVEGPVVEEITEAPVTETISEAPATPVVTPASTPAPAETQPTGEAAPAEEAVPAEESAPTEEPIAEPTPDPEEAERADAAGIREYVERCYTVILGRKGEEDGIVNWINQLSSGAMGGAAVVRGFVASQEFIAKKYSDRQVVTILYNAMLGREPDAAGLKDWVGHMEVGMTSDAIVAGFAGSQEFMGICQSYGIIPGNFTPTEWRDRNYGVTAFVFRAYKLILNRAAEPDGQNNWCAQLLTGQMAGADIVMQFLGSREFLNRYMSAGDLVDVLYNTMLGRAADAAGKADWLGRLQKGQQVSAIVNGFSGSQEFMGICKQYGIDPGSINEAAAPHVHAWDDGKIVKEATATEDGEKQFTCYTCGTVRKVAISLNVWKYKIENGEVIITGYLGADTAISVPATLENKPVTVIGAGAFENRTALTGVTLPGSIKTLEDNAFRGCDHLTTVTIPEGVQTIGGGAFSGCLSLETVSLPDSLKTIGGSAFGQCAKLTAVTVPDGVTDIGADAFPPETKALYVSSRDAAATDALGRAGYGYRIPDDPFRYRKVYDDNKAYLGSAITGCDSAVSGEITVPDGIDRICEKAFYNCDKITGITLPDGIGTLEQNVFPRKGGYKVYVSSHDAAVTDALGKADHGYTLSGDRLSYKKVYRDGACLGLYVTDCDPEATGTVTVPDAVTDIGGSAFDGCKKITDVVLPRGIKTIGARAFRGCNGLKRITLPDGVAEIASSAFGSPVSCDIYVGSHTAAVTEALGKAGIGYRLQNDPLTYEKKYDGNGVYRGWYVTGCDAEAAGTVTVPDVVTDIGDDAFNNCAKITGIVLPPSVKTIGARAFRNCNGLERITLPDGVAGIDPSAFGLSPAFDIYVSAHTAAVTDVLGKARYGYRLQNDPLTYEKRYNDAGVYQGWYVTQCDAGATGTVTVPDVVTDIGENAFKDRETITGVVLHQNILTIGYEAFHGCDGLKSITLPDSVTDIGGYAFGSPVSCDIFVSSADAAVTELLGKVHYGFRLQNDPLTYEKRYNDNGVYLGGYVTRCDTGATGTVTVPGGVTKIDRFAFYGCKDITEVVLHQNITAIGLSAFGGCDSLKSITLPDSVTEIGASAFDRSDVYVSSHNAPVTEVLGKAGHGYRLRNDPLTYTKRYDNGGAYQGLAVTGCESGVTGKVTVPEGVTAIGEKAFSGCKRMTSIVISGSVTEIGSNAFNGCKGITYVSVPGTVDTIGSKAFYDCASLTEVVLQEGVTEIGDRAFYTSSVSLSVTLPRSVTTIASNAFSLPLTIYCYANSDAESWAINNGKSYFRLDGDPDFNAIGKVSFSVGEKKVLRGSAYSLPVIIAPSSLAPTPVWTSFDTSVATVADGVLTPVKVGDTTVTVEVGTKTASMKITVVEPPTDMIVPSAINVVVGTSQQIPVQLIPAGADSDLTWTASNGHAPVNSDGKVKGNAVGDTVITVETENGLSKTCTVHVINPPEE